MSTTLWNLKPSESATILEDRNENILVKKRLFELGFGPKMQVTCVESLPMGGPKCFITTRGEFALDREILENLQIERVL